MMIMLGQKPGVNLSIEISGPQFLAGGVKLTPVKREDIYLSEETIYGPGTPLGTNIVKQTPRYPLTQGG